MKRIRGSGRAAVALVVVVGVLALLTTGCGAMVGKTAVRAVARGVPTAAPFFKKLGTDIAIGEALSYLAGEVGGDDPGLYGGTRDAGHCDKAGLVDFLQKPSNRRKAEEWAAAEGLDGVGEIKGFVKKLTPVLLRADTLVKNHDFDAKKGKRTAFDALLEAGIAVLVDQFGRPAVQCSCGNPLASFEHDVDKADVKFDDRNKKWPAYDAKKVAKVKPAPEDEPVEVYQLVDVEEPDTGLAREAGSDGTGDEVLPEVPDPGEESVSPSASDTVETVTVPDVQGRPLSEATAALEAEGFQVGTTEAATDLAAPGTVIGQSPEAGTSASGGSLVTLTVASGDTSGTGEPVTADPTVTDGGTDAGATAGSGEFGGDGSDTGTSDPGDLSGGDSAG
ncbi:DUF6777 domain-containing protein [Streptomyces lanatus]|uniref:DUF6777 domain-containing protein n=1 Tax=Streptomyces lanatus TaxID=66900 RepID=A0ABV1XLJ1_9ACTN|nr:DUF6777 domain-containing protein [Streptomyces lanatus]GHG99136.1 hypothetical protein GCM10018780_25610 [Streptomyces lanatus]